MKSTVSDDRDILLVKKDLNVVELLTKEDKLSAMNNRERNTSDEMLQKKNARILPFHGQKAKDRVLFNYHNWSTNYLLKHNAQFRQDNY